MQAGAPAGGRPGDEGVIRPHLGHRDSSGALWPPGRVLGVAVASQGLPVPPAALMCVDTLRSCSDGLSA